MKRILISIIITLFPIIAFAQGRITRPQKHIVPTKKPVSVPPVKKVSSDSINQIIDSDSQSNEVQKSTIYIYYIFKAGDTLYSVARKHGTTVAKLQQLNGLKANSIVQVGQVLIVKESESASIPHNDGVSNN